MPSSSLNRRPAPAKVSPPASAQGGCAVSHSLAELKRAYTQGRVPSAVELTGSWVAIGDFFQTSGPSGKESDKVDCMGVRTYDDGPFESVLLVNGYSVEPRIVANEWNTGTRQAFKRDGPRRSVTFGLGFGGDASAYFRCRLTQKATLARLEEPYYIGVEFRKMPVRPDRCDRSPLICFQIAIGFLSR